MCSSPFGVPLEVISNQHLSLFYPLSYSGFFRVNFSHPKFFSSLSTLFPSCFRPLYPMLPSSIFLPQFLSLPLSCYFSLSLLKFSSCSCQTSLFFALFSYIGSPVPDLSLSQNHSHHSLLLSLSLKSSPSPITHFLSTTQSLSLPLSSFSSLFLPLMHLCSSVLSHFLNFSSSLLWDHSHPLYFPLSLSLSLSLTFFFCLDFQLPLQFCPLYS